MLNQMARKLLRSGYDRNDLLRAMNDDVEEQRTAILSARGEKSVRTDRLLKRLTLGGLGVHLSALAWLAFGPFFPGGGGVAAGVMAASMATWATAGLASAVREQQHGRLQGRGWLKFWQSRMGSGLFRTAAIGLDEQPTGVPYGPTELAISMAADRLFDALPTVQRSAFRELPEVVRRLEGDAEQMRARMRELDAIIDQMGDDTTAAGHEELRDELATTRAAAEERLVQVVAALETIRVELLRLHAGAVSVESVTMDLNAARKLSSDVARVLEGRREVDRFLGRSTDPGLRPTPTPA
jgi:serine/threonine-protein kinase